MENCNKPDSRPDPGNDKAAAISQSSSGNQQHIIRVLNYATSAELYAQNGFIVNGSNTRLSFSLIN